MNNTNNTVRRKEDCEITLDYNGKEGRMINHTSSRRMEWRWDRNAFLFHIITAANNEYKKIIQIIIIIVIIASLFIESFGGSRFKY